MACETSGAVNPEGKAVLQARADCADLLVADFQGCPTWKDGYLYGSEAPGWGIEVDEKLAANYPITPGPTGGGDYNIRRLDGTAVKY